MNSTTLSAIDAFAGAGGLSLGLRWAGFDVRAAYDFDRHAVETYRHNLDDRITCASAEDLSGDVLMRQAGLQDGECDLLTGGPPCQGFSVQRRGADVDERNDLVLQFLRQIDEVRPRAFLMENVSGLAGRRGANILTQFAASARKIGYNLQQTVLDAADYGVPQHRRRLFVVGMTEERTFTFPDPTHSTSDWVTVRTAISDLPVPLPAKLGPPALPNHQLDNISDLNRQRISHVPEGGGRDDIPEALRLPCHRVSVDRAGHRGVYGRLWWDRPAGTITTKCNSFTRGRFGHPAQDRNITMREAARLQGFPDDYVFLGGRVEVAHQVGNAVPPPLGMALGQALAKQLSSDA